MTRLEDKLAMSLYRINCPDSTELGEYHLGMVPNERAQFIKAHLDECPHCARESVQLKDYLAELAPELEPGRLEQIRERVRVLVARLVSGKAGEGLIGQPALAPAYAGVRGEEQEPFVYQADEVQIVVEVQDDTEQPGHKVILGLVIGAESTGVSAHLWQAEQCVTVIPVDELGNFVIPDLTPGSYELILSGPELEIHIQDLQVGARSPSG